MYSFALSLKIHCTVKFQHSLSNDSAYTVRSVRAIVIWIFHTESISTVVVWLSVTSQPRKCQQITESIQPTIQMMQGIKVGAWNWQNRPTCKMKDDRNIQPLPLHFVKGEVYIPLLLINEVSDVVIRGYIKVRNLCAILRMTLHSAASWIYQVLVLFITVINPYQ